MQPEEIKKLIEDELDGVDAQVSGDGSHYEAIVVGDIFAGKSMVEQQRMVYSPLNAYIINGEIHALTIKAYTPDDWKTAQKLRVS
jgi:acid stress-induced BolA-like protein IbaG/YrbA